jgi:hypothetical protein
MATGATVLSKKLPAEELPRHLFLQSLFVINRKWLNDNLTCDKNMDDRSYNIMYTKIIMRLFIWQRFL